MSTPEAWTPHRIAEIEDAALAQLQHALVVLGRCPEGALLDRLAMALSQLTTKCEERADSLERAVQRGAHELQEFALRARLLATATSRVGDLVRARALRDGDAAPTGAQQTAVAALLEGLRQAAGPPARS